MDSMPPPTPTSTSPARIAWSRITVARRPEAHTLLTVSDDTSLGMPALIWAWREGICPWPACRTWPMTTWSTCSGATSARSSAAVIAVAPRSVASMEDRPPPSFPIGVRAAPRMTVLGMRISRSLWSGQDSWSRNGNEWPRIPCSPMRVTATTEAAASTAADTIVVGLIEGEGVPHDVERGALQALPDAGDAQASPRHLAVAHVAGKRWILVGLGARARLDGEALRIAAATAHGRARDLGARVLCWELPHKARELHPARAVVEGALMAAYAFTAFKTGAGLDGDDAPDGIQELIVSDHDDR